MRRTAPGGEPPPQSFEPTDGRRVDLAPLAARACARYYEVYPDDLERYGDAGRAWCDHDSRYLLAWSLEDARSGDVDCVEQVRWLARVLAARKFPVERLARHAELTAEAIEAAGELGPLGERAAARLREAAGSIAEGAAPAG